MHLSLLNKERLRQLRDAFIIGYLVEIVLDALPRIINFRRIQSQLIFLHALEIFGISFILAQPLLQLQIFLQKRTNLFLLAALAVNHTIMHLLDRFLCHFCLMLKLAQFLRVDAVNIG